jgi:WD40 repeat protein
LNTTFWAIHIDGVCVYAAWSISLHPNSETYASTGGSGNVLIHSAQVENFGERLATLSPGPQKFGMTCSHVRFFFFLRHREPAVSLTPPHPPCFRKKSPDGKRVALAAESGQIFIFDLESNALATSFHSHAMSVRSLAWSYDCNVCYPFCSPFFNCPNIIPSLIDSYERIRRQTYCFARRLRPSRRIRPRLFRPLFLGSKR